MLRRGGSVRKHDANTTEQAIVAASIWGEKGLYGPILQPVCPKNVVDGSSKYLGPAKIRECWLSEGVWLGLRIWKYGWLYRWVGRVCRSKQSCETKYSGTKLQPNDRGEVTLAWPCISWSSETSEPLIESKQPGKITRRRVQPEPRLPSKPIASGQELFR